MDNKFRFNGLLIGLNCLCFDLYINSDVLHIKPKFYHYTYALVAGWRHREFKPKAKPAKNLILGKLMILLSLPELESNQRSMISCRTIRVRLKF